MNYLKKCVPKKENIMAQGLEALDPAQISIAHIGW
jgi:hypothetical protein